MLEINNTEYRISDLLAIGKQATNEYGEKLVPATSVGADGLTWGHLVDPRIPLLVKTRGRYRFASWTELERLLDTAWRYDAEDPRTHVIPIAVSRKIVLPRGAPYSVHPDMRLEDLLAELRNESGACSEIMAVSEPDVNWATAVESADRLPREAALQKLWGGCGPASQSLIERLYAVGGQPVRTYARIFEGVEDARLLQAFLKIGVKDTVLIQISEEAIHEFTIEKRPDGKAYLHQGYLSGYSAVWWAGAAAADRVPFFTLSGKDAEKMRACREEYGGGSPIPIDRFADLLYAYLLADEHGAESAKVWSRLPFHPGVTDEDARWKGRSIALSVDVFQLAAEENARKALGDNGRNHPITALLMKEAVSLIRS